MGESGHNYGSISIAIFTLMRYVYWIPPSPPKKGGDRESPPLRGGPGKSPFLRGTGKVPLFKGDLGGSVNVLHHQEKGYTCQRAIVWSQLPETSTRPSGLKASDLTASECPTREAICSPVFPFHRARVLSQLPEASLSPSG